MAITKMDEVLAAIQAGKTNDEIRDEIDGRLSDKRIDVLRAHPAIRGGSGVKNEIESRVAEIFAPASEAEMPDEPVRMGCVSSGEPAEALSQIKVRAGCDFSAGRPQRVTSITQDAVCDLRLREDEVRHLTRKQRTEPERQLNGQTGADAIRINAPAEEEPVSTARLKVVGIDLEGLLNYHVDTDGITIEADCVLIEAEQISGLLMELELVACRQREMREESK